MKDLYILTQILLAHAIGDIAFQTKYMASRKSHNIFALVCHCATVAGIYYLVMGIQSWKTPLVYRPYLFVFWLQFLTHTMIDGFTARLKSGSMGMWTYIDVGLHFIVGVITWLWLRKV